jgi:hypothetical protein
MPDRDQTHIEPTPEGTSQEQDLVDVTGVYLNSDPAARALITNPLAKGGED